MAQAQLSDGNLIDIPEIADPADISRMMDQGEKQLNEYYAAQAAQKNAPVVNANGSKVYSATTNYPNSVVGNVMAWLDHNAGGNWVNRNVVQPVDQWQQSHLGGTVEAPLARAESNAVAGVVDMPGSVVNAITHAVGSPKPGGSFWNPREGWSPFSGNVPDVPSVSGNIRSEVGVPEVAYDAPFWQRAAEATGAGVLSGGKSVLGAWPLIKEAAVNTAGTFAGDVGEKFGGEQGSLIGQVLSTLGLHAGGKALAKSTAPSLRDPNAQRSWEESQQIKPSGPGENFQGLPASSAPTGGPDLSTYTPSFTVLSNPTGQRVAAALRSIPITGAPIASASEFDRSFIQGARDAVANALMGPRGTGGAPGEKPSAATIGPVLTEGAQTAITKISQDEAQKQQAMANMMTHRNQQLMSGQSSQVFGPQGSNEPGSARVELPNTAAAAADATVTHPVSGSLRGEQTADAAQKILDEITAASPGGPRGPQVSQTGGPLPTQPSMSWQQTNELVQRLSDTFIKTGRSPVPPDIANAIKKAALDEQQQAADAMSNRPPAPGQLTPGDQFRANRQSYAQAEAALEKLRKMGGQEQGSGANISFPSENVPKEAAVTRELTGNMQSPSYFTNTLLHPAFPQENRLNAVGQVVSSLGNTSQGGFRPETFVDDLRGERGVRPALNDLTVGGPGNATPHAGLPILDKAANLAENFSTPTSRFGLQQTLGASGFIGKAMEGTARGLEHLTDFPGIKLATPWFARLYSQGLESEAMRRALANQPQDWSTMVKRVPTLGSLIASSNPQRFGPSYSYNPSPLQ